ncbi:low molecular weight protein-tyrosine-phosphatase [Leucothrix mucor]|uniref:low molecular weight protein-tyrosine-phosphatase n=1 Tax=Leucothrix mucor TaxID=45248 RepID=UPI0003B3DD5B|nr:low molecular weight protein-tyrosine-phosphatase [Leucothrix mucor]
MSKTNVLFVCMGNICRSPTAHGVFQALVKRNKLSDKIHVDSAGTHAYHVGEPPDKRAQSTALKQGYNLSAQRARQVTVDDFERFDYVIAMDQANMSALRKLTPPALRQRVHLLMSYAPQRPETEVPDPYYGGPQGFETVLDMVEVASQGLLDHILSQTD